MRKPSADGFIFIVERTGDCTCHCCQLCRLAGVGDGTGYSTSGGVRAGTACLSSWADEAAVVASLNLNLACGVTRLCYQYFQLTVQIPVAYPSYTAMGLFHECPSSSRIMLLSRAVGGDYSRGKGANHGIYEK